jgi:hypothetical protein
MRQPRRTRPRPAGSRLPPGVAEEPLAFAFGQEAPALYRLTFAPGVIYAVAPAPEISLVYAEGGALTVPLDAPVKIHRAGATAAPGQAITAWTELTLTAGHYAVSPPLVRGEVRNEGTEAAAVDVATIVPSGMAPAVATPVP